MHLPYLKKDWIQEMQKLPLTEGAVLTMKYAELYDLQVGETREFYCQYTVKQKDLIRGYVLNRAVVTGDPIPDPKNPDEPKIPKGEGIEIDYTNPTPMGTGIINLNVGDCCE